MVDDMTNAADLAISMHSFTVPEPPIRFFPLNTLSLFFGLGFRRVPAGPITPPLRLRGTPSLWVYGLLEVPRLF